MPEGNRNGSRIAERLAKLEAATPASAKGGTPRR